MVVLDYSATMLLDSVAPNGVRLSTFEVTMPRWVLAEFNTHRRLSRNAASSRAIPINKCIQWVLDQPCMPVEWGLNQPGMQASATLSSEDEMRAIMAWLKFRDQAVACAEELVKLNVHKQLGNRVLELFRWVTVITTATEWSNFFGLRCDEQAQPEIRRPANFMLEEYLDLEEDFPDMSIDAVTPEFIRVAHLMRNAYEDSKPKYMNIGDWHMPMLRPTDFEECGATNYGMLRKISTGRCCRISYETHHGVRDIKEDAKLHDRLITSKHWSPLEHIATPMEDKYVNRASGNFFGWTQYRQLFDGQELR